MSKTHEVLRINDQKNVKMRLFSVGSLEFLKMNAIMMRIHRYERLKNFCNMLQYPEKEPSDG